MCWAANPTTTLIWSTCFRINHATIFFPSHPLCPISHLPMLCIIAGTAESIVEYFFVATSEKNRFTIWPSWCTSSTLSIRDTWDGSLCGQLTHIMKSRSASCCAPIL